MRKPLGRRYSSTAPCASNVVEKIGGSARKSPGEESFALQLKEAGIEYEREVKIVDGRKFRVDFRILGLRNAVVEIEGQIFKKGGHTSSTGIMRDMEKYNLLTVCGYEVYRFTTGQIMDGSALKWLKENVLNMR
jgi:very-short-patch-repair endonuclease